METVECPYCRKWFPMSGTENVFRHLMIAESETPRGRAILMTLGRLPLPRSQPTTPRSSLPANR